MKKIAHQSFPIFCYLLVSGCLFLQEANGQLQAGFSANTTSGCAPLVVAFSDESTGNASSWQWDLGNGTVSYFQNPSTVYFSPGTYSVKLIVKNAAGSDSVVKQHYITVHNNPRAGFMASDTTGCYPLKIQFTDTSTVAGSVIAQWQWDFGDGNTSGQQHPVHTYRTAGNHTVTLKVTSDKGCTHTISRERHIRISDGVKAGFSDSSDKKCTAPATIYFSNASTGPGTLTYNWNFGDGTSSALQHPQHSYISNGNYTVTLVTVSSEGCRDTVRKQNLVKVGTTNTDFNAPDSVCAGRPVSFTNSSVPAPLSAHWDFGDGSASDTMHPQKIYSTPGVYAIKLINTYGHCIDSITKPVEAFPSPVASFTADHTNACSIPFTVRFTAGVAGTAYYWEFGDGTVSTEQNPVHAYSAFGRYTVKFFVTGAGGCMDSVIKEDFISIQPPQLRFNGLPARGCLPLTVPFSATTAGGENIVQWQWDFGDGTSATEASPVKTYAAEGEYTVTLIAVTASGCTDTTILRDAVRVSKKPEAAFSATPADACAAQPVMFTNSSSPAGTAWKWEFGDGGTSGAEDPTYKYNDTGYFNVTLITWNNECSDTLVKNNFIHIRPPVARFTTRVDCHDKYLRTFWNTSIGAESYLWNFGDGTTSTNRDAVHRYTAKGRYSVTLIVTNGGCTDSTIRQVTIADEHLDFATDATEICKGLPVNFQLLDYVPAYTSTVEWDFGDGTVSGQKGPVSHVYKKAGWYTVSLRFKDVNGCTDSVIKQQYVLIYGPTAGFTVDRQTICEGATAVFPDSSTTDGTHPVTQWSWQFGDGTSSTHTSPPFVHQYAETGTYTVKLKISDSYGCTDSVTRPAVLIVTQPTAAFTSVDTNSCPGKPVAFKNASRGTGLTYHWDFGDGTSSTAQSPVHRYQAEGRYTVRLHVVDAYGCSDSTEKVEFIRITIPVALFQASDTVSACPPLQVQFTSQARNYSTLKWDFGDGSSSVLENPEHFYNFPGTYYVKQIISGPGGCTDTAVKKLIVKGPQGSFTYAPLTGCKPLTVNLQATSPHKVSFVWDYNDGTVLPATDSNVTHTYTTAGNFVPKLILIDTAGCRVPVVGKDTVHVIGVTAKAAIQEYRICDSGFIQFVDQSIANDYITGHYWDFGDGAGSTIASPPHYYNDTGSYSVTHTVTTEQGCTDAVSLTDTIKVWPTPRIAIGGDEAACVPATLIFRPRVPAGDSAALNWHWNFGNGTVSYTAQPDSQTYQVAGNYTVRAEATYMDFCRDTALHPLTIHPLPATNAGPDTVVCRSFPIQLHATGAGNFVWETTPDISCTQCAAPQINPSASTSYVVNGYSINGCSKKDTVLVRVRQPFTLQVPPGDTLCNGESTVLAASGAELYQWIPATGLDQADAASPKASPSQSIIYTVIGKDSDGCFADTGKVPITVYPVPRVFAGNDTTVITGTILPLQPVYSPDISRWEWTPGTRLSCPDCPAPKASVKATITYRVQVANEGGCTASDDITIRAECNTGNYYLPNTFSPNGDGMNDVFYVRGKGLNRIHSLRIFNRWGQVVFEKRDIAPNDPQAGWDGMVNGKKAEMDVYVYIAEIICDNSAIIPYKGNVTLIR